MLPNLPGLARFWQSGAVTVPILLGQPTEIAPPDASRWAIGICPGLIGQISVWFNPENALTEGITITSGQQLVMFYKDWGPLMQGAIYAVDQAGKGTASIYWSCIVNVADPAAATGREGGN